MNIKLSALLVAFIYFGFGMANQQPTTKRRFMPAAAPRIGLWGVELPEPGACNFACGANYLAPGWFNFSCGANYPHQAVKGGYFVIYLYTTTSLVLYYSFICVEMESRNLT